MKFTQCLGRIFWFPILDLHGESNTEYKFLGTGYVMSLFWYIMKNCHPHFAGLTIISTFNLNTKFIQRN